ncbi:MAG: hypothetical protein WCR27_08090 [Eubacteriales bacterium]
MYILKICRCCESVLGEIEIENLTSLSFDDGIELVGNVAYTVCPKCMKDLEMNNQLNYLQ